MCQCGQKEESQMTNRGFPVGQLVKWQPCIKMGTVSRGADQGGDDEFLFHVGAERSTGTRGAGVQ